jgi:hypothetical protein
LTFNENSKIGHIWASEAGRAVLLKHLPSLADSPYLSFIKMSTLPKFAVSNDAWVWPEGMLETILAELAVVDEEPQEQLEQAVRTDYEPEEIAIGSAGVAAPKQVAKWDVFELSLAGPSHGNPFTEVSLEAVFTGSEGQTVRVTGFYDGNGSYKIRFMPGTEGTWSYRTASNARSLHQLEGTVECTAAAEGNHGPVRVKNTFHFAYEDGTPYIPVGTTCYVWNHQTVELEQETLTTLKSSPFNKMRMCVFPKSYQFNQNEPPYYPFEGSLEQGWDYTRFNPEFFRHLEERIADLAELGIEADLILFHAYDRWGFSEMSKASDDRYLKYVTARLAAYRNVWWSLANEYDLMWAKEIEDWERFADIVTADDPYNHLISIHNCFGFYDYSRPWVTHCSVQRVDVYRTAENTDEWRRTWNKPIVIDECAYEGNIDLGWGNIAGEEMVRRFWEGAIRGGYVGHGETYLHPEDILWWSKGGKLYGTSPERIGFLRRVQEEAPNGELNPLKSEWDVPCAGVADRYYLFYYGFNQPSYRNFSMKPGIVYKADVIDTWNMTIQEMDGVYEGNFRLELPGRSYMAVRLTAVEA